MTQEPEPPEIPGRFRNEKGKLLPEVDQDIASLAGDEGASQMADVADLRPLTQEEVAEDLRAYGVPAVQVDRLGLDNPPAARVEIGA